jgi:hypothetical protein
MIASNESRQLGNKSYKITKWILIYQGMGTQTLSCEEFSYRHREAPERQSSFAAREQKAAINFRFLVCRINVSHSEAALRGGVKVL